MRHVLKEWDMTGMPCSNEDFFRHSPYADNFHYGCHVIVHGIARTA